MEENVATWQDDWKEYKGELKVSACTLRWYFFLMAEQNQWFVSFDRAQSDPKSTFLVIILLSFVHFRG